MAWNKHNLIILVGPYYFCGIRSKVLSDLFTKFIAAPLAKLVETVFCFTITTPMIAQGAFVLILASNFFYVLYNQMRYKESILAGLLDDTIL